MNSVTQELTKVGRVLPEQERVLTCVEQVLLNLLEVFALPTIPNYRDAQPQCETGPSVDTQIRPVVDT